MEQDPTHPTGVRDTSDFGRVPATVVRARERKAWAALELALERQSYDEIAEVLGYPTARDAKLAVELLLSKRAQESDRQAMRELAGAQLERLSRSVMQRAVDPKDDEHLTAVRVAKELIGQHAELFGYKAPSEVVLRAAPSEEIQRVVADLLERERPAVSEADIFEIEFTEEVPDAAPSR